MKMKTAKEMFEELGYEYEIDEEFIECEKNEVQFEIFRKWLKIVFVLSGKYFYCDEDYESMAVDVPTFKAIQQQLKELGWLDEN